MKPEVLTSQILVESLLKGFMFVLPYFIPLIATAIVVMIIKIIVKKSVYGFSYFTGDSKRLAKKKANVAGDIVDLTSSINDVMGEKK